MSIPAPHPEQLVLDPDPTVGHPHPARTTTGAAVGAIAGTAIGTIVAGPLGAAVGALAGTIVGGITGKVSGDMFDPTAEAEHWHAHHYEQSFVDPGYDYEDYEPGYRTGYANYTPGETFEQAEEDLKRFYGENGGRSRLAWEKARPAAEAAWHRMEQVLPRAAYDNSAQASQPFE